MFDVNQIVLDQGILETYVENVSSLPNDEYALLRKNTFGGSDASILCNVNLYKSLKQLLEEKNCKYITDEEKAVGKKPIVKKGRDLEPFILEQAEKMLNTPILKPSNMFRFKAIPALTVNYDGIAEIGENIVPVEAKLVSKYGEKYYNKEVTVQEAMDFDMSIEGDSLEQHIKRKSVRFGIPGYYYTQVQAQLSGTNSPYAYLIAWFDESWSGHLYYIKRDEYVIAKIHQIASEQFKHIIKD